MKTLNLTKETALNLYNKGNDTVREILTGEFGTELFTTKITDRVTSYEDALAIADDKVAKDCEIFPTDTPDVAAYKKLKLIVAVINEGWTPNWNDGDQKKWWPWFRVGSSGSGFDLSYSNYYCDYADTAVGSRLCLETREKCDYVVSHFFKLYEQFLLTK